MTVKAQGAALSIHNGVLSITPSLLSASLYSDSRRDIALSDITDISTVNGTRTMGGTLTITCTDKAVSVRFPPNADIDRCKRWINDSSHAEVEPLALFDVNGNTLSPAGQPGLDFVAIAVNTASSDWGSLTDLAAVRFRDGMPSAQSTDSKVWTCQSPVPTDESSNSNESLFADIAADIVSFLGEDIVVAHNVQFAATTVHLAARATGQKLSHLRTACTLALSRHASRTNTLHVDNHNLATIARAIGISNYDEDVLSDKLLAQARATGLILSALAASQSVAGEGNFLEALFNAEGFQLGYFDQREVMPVLRTVTAPVSKDDVGAGTDFRDTSEHTALETDGDSGTSAALTDPWAPKPQVQRSACSRRPAPWESVATPDTIPEPNSDADESSPLYGQYVTLTGDFEPFDKGMLWNGIAHLGGTVGKNVTKKTTIVVIGSWANKTSKEKRAEELIAQGQGIQMWPAERLFDVLGLQLEPPF